MSRPFSWRQVIRCPLCRDGRKPQHVGNSVMLCECCGNRFRIVSAQVGKTGTRLGLEIDGKVRWAPNFRGKQ